MTRRQSRFDFERPDLEMFSFRDRVRALFRFEFGNVNRRVRRLL